MKAIIRNLTALLFFTYSTFTYSQVSHYPTDEAKKDWDYPIKGLSTQEIRKAVYGIQAYNTGSNMLDGSGIPIMRDSIEMKKTATTPALYIDSLFYENILNAPLLDYEELLLNRFPYLIMNNMGVTDEIMKVMDSLASVKPNITTEEYWQILKKDYAEIIGGNFKWLNDAKKQITTSPYRTIGNIRMARQMFTFFAPTTKNKISIEAKPYLEKLGTLPSDSLYFVKPKHQTILTVEDFWK